MADDLSTEELNKQISQMQDIVELQKERLDGAKELSKYAEEYGTILDNEMKIRKKELAQLEEKRKKQMELLAIAQEEGDVEAIQKATDSMEDLGKQIDKTADAFKKLTREAEALGRTEKRIEKFAATFLGIKKSSPGVIKDFISMTKGAGGFSGALKNLGASFTSVINPASIATSIFSKIAEVSLLYAKQVDSSSTSLARLTGATTKYNKSLFDNSKTLLKYGLTVEDIGASMGTLYTNMLNSTELTKEQQTELALTSTELTKLGVSADTTTDIYDGLIKSMGFTTEQAVDMTKGMVSLAQDLQMPPQMLVEGFAEATKSLASYGKQAPKIFKRVAASAKATGIKIGRLLDITEQFDTFEGAAQAAGSLNQILGGDLVNSMELIGATEEERIAILQRVGSVAKQQYAGMSDMQQRFFVKSLGKSLGIADQEVMKFMNTSGDALDQYTKKADKSETDQEKLNKTLQASTTIAEKLAGAVQLLAPPLEKGVMAFDEMLNGAFGLNSELKKLIDLGPGISGALTAVGAAGMVSQGLGMIIEVKNAIKAVKGASGAGGGGTPILGGAGGAAQGAGKVGMLGKGLGFLGTAGLAGVAGVLTAQMVKSVYDVATGEIDMSLGEGERKIRSFLGMSPQTPNTNLGSKGVPNLRNAAATPASAPTAQAGGGMRDRDFVMKIDGREIGRIASEQMKKEYSYSYG